jgi:hypothetical protein
MKSLHHERILPLPQEHSSSTWILSVMSSLSYHMAEIVKKILSYTDAKFASLYLQIARLRFTNKYHKLFNIHTYIHTHTYTHTHTTILLQS